MSPRSLQKVILQNSVCIVSCIEYPFSFVQAPVIKGVKYGANVWVHMNDFQDALLNNCV